MKIVMEKPVKGRLQDAVDALFALNEDDFNRVLQEFKNGSGNGVVVQFVYTTDNCARPDMPIKMGLIDNKEDLRSYYASERVKSDEFFAALGKYVPEQILVDADETARATAILNLCGLDTFQKHYANFNGCSMRSVETAFSVLQNEKVLYEFLNTSDSMQNIVVDDQMFKKREVFEVLGDIFGYPADDGEFKRAKGKMNNYYVPELGKMIENYAKLYNSGYNLDRYANDEYTFKAQFTKTGAIYRCVGNCEFDINPQLKREVYEDMPSDLTTEEKAVYIYAKLCSVLEYDDGIIEIEGKRISKIEKSRFDKSALESIKPNGKIICYDFARICARFLNELDGVTAMVLSQGLIDGHYLTGFYTDKVSARLEAINVSGESSLNDLARAHNKLELAGIDIISDKFGIFPTALEKAYASVYCRGKTTIADFVSQIKEQKSAEAQLDKLIEAFIQTLREKHICGNEATLIYNAFKKNGFFGTEIESIYIGDKHTTENGTFYQRKILLRQNGDENPYLIDVVNLISKQISAADVAKNLQSKQFVYESNKYQLKGLETVKGND